MVINDLDLFWYALLQGALSLNQALRLHFLDHFNQTTWSLNQSLLLGVCNNFLKYFPF
jgi:hypothetical protein